MRGTAAMPLSAVQTEYRDRVMTKMRDGTYTLENVSCLCGSVDGVRLAHEDRFGLPVGVVLCRACGLARTSPRLAASNLAEFYERDYHGLHQGIRDPDPDQVLFRRGQGVAIAGFMAGLLPAGPLRVADIGAGTGQVLREFAAAVERPVHGIGCEYSSAFVQAGRQTGSDLRVGGPEAIVGDGPFDVVILSHVVEHFPNPVAELAAVRALGHEQTLFYVEVPGLLAIDSKPEYNYELAQYLTLAHTFHFTLRSLEATMRQVGFELIRGDEGVHSLFRMAEATSTDPDPELATTVTDSLARLTSWRVQARRLWRQVRPVVATIAKALLPGRVVRAIRQRRPS